MLKIIAAPMSIFLEFVTDHFFKDRRVPPPDEETRNRHLADALRDFFRDDPKSDHVHVMLDLQKECGVKLRAAFIAANHIGKMHAIETENTTIWAFSLSRQDITEAAFVLDEIEQALRHDAHHPLVCVSYKKT